ncbi:MAG: septal ring lytic transglycosylase RlpA family protein [Verrucomicrobiota bacterium]|nr:septal ring lytic transglycosylase RlpA family protein [Verrucomicrobiota bacterium]
MPSDSLAARRARPGALTVAHDRLPIGTKLRVTNLSNGKTVTVRVTDRGVPRRKGTLDLCKEAAAQLDMIRAGSARVRMEVLPQDDGDATTAAP